MNFEKLRQIENCIDLQRPHKITKIFKNYETTTEQDF